MQTIKEMFCNILKYSFRLFRLSSCTLDMNIGQVLTISCTLIIHVAPTCQFHATPGFITL